MALTANKVPYATDGDHIDDSPIEVSVPGSMVNGVTVTGGASGTSPTIAATGSGTNLALVLKGKGTHGVRFGDGSGTGSDAPMLNIGTPFGDGLTLIRGDLNGSGQALDAGQVNARVGLYQWDGTNYIFQANSNGASLASDKQFLFSSTTSANGSKDAGIARVAANVVKASDGSTGYSQMRVQSLGVNNSASGSTPGTVTKKIEVFDASGASLGFIAVYDAIT